jgi:hypothetical protein
MAKSRLEASQSEKTAQKKKWQNDSETAPPVTGTPMAKAFHLDGESIATAMAKSRLLP